ncbi:MAG: outer membrane beta-barrel protein [Cytophagaceae bacterium]|nr:outer membrane beta-barrel protein [Cytophagaceae bacterium]
MKKLLLLTFAAMISFAVSAQSYSIKGTLKDTSNAPLSFTSVFLLLPSDSSLVTFSRADENGNFVFKNIKKQNYLLKATFVGFLPLQELIKFDPAVLNKELGDIVLKPIQKELFEVVIRTAKAPMEIRGDTIEYDARKFKVPPGSSVEDLLRKLPGVQIDAEGNIKAQGEEVKKVLVDGKRFFGDDPKVATKNLPAEAINKVQVFNDKSEASKVTGVEDGKHEKTVNLELKEEFKKGGFGKGTVGAGTDDRLMAKMNYNKFDKKNQFAIVGFGNNINQSGLSNNDYQDFRGSQSYQWNDNADFGFNSGGAFRIIYDDGSSNDESLEIPQSWGPGQGLSKNLAGGMNYNYDTKKTKFSSNYFFNQTDQSLNQIINSRYLFSNLSYNTADSSRFGNFIQNHRLSLRFEKELDSLNTLVTYVNGRFGFRNQSTFTMRDFNNNASENFRNQKTDNSFDGSSHNIVGSAIYRHKFMKKGRNFSLSGTFSESNNDQDALQESLLKEFPVNGQSFPLGGFYDIFQNVLNLSQNREYKASALFIEPFKKKFFWETFYNFSVANRLVDRDVFSLFTDSKPRVDSLSRYFESNQVYNRLGSSVRYSHKGFNLSVGLAAQQIDITGQFFNTKGGKELGVIDNPYFSVVPNIGLNVQLKNNKYLFANFDTGVEAPSIRNLQPFADNSNPLYIRNGNPDLLPTTTRSVGLGFGSFNPATFINMWLNINGSFIENQVVQNQFIDSKTLLTTLTPENVSGGKRFQSYFDLGFPIKKTKVSAGLGLNNGISKNLVYINSVLNENLTQYYGLNLRLDLTPVAWFSMFSALNYGLNFSDFSINSAQNQKFNNTSIRNNLTLQMPKMWYFSADFNYSHFKNEKQNFDQHLPILNVSTYKIFGKGKKSELRLSLYDAFKRNLGVNQSAYLNVVSNTVTQTLSRYAMLSYTYNMKGMKTTMKKSRWE